MKNSYLNKFAAAFIILSLCSIFSFASTPAEKKSNSSSKADTWEQAIIKQAVPIKKEQTKLENKAALKEALREEKLRKQPGYMPGATMMPKGDRPDEQTPMQIKLARILRVSGAVEHRYNTPQYRERGEQISSVYKELQTALNANPLFEYYNVDPNSLEDFANITPSGIAFVKELFKNFGTKEAVFVQPYKAYQYKSGAVVAYFKNIKGEPQEIILNFYPKGSYVSIMLGGRSKYYAELQGESSALKI